MGAHPSPDDNPTLAEDLEAALAARVELGRGYESAQPPGEPRSTSPSTLSRCCRRCWAITWLGIMAVNGAVGAAVTARKRLPPD